MEFHKTSQCHQRAHKEFQNSKGVNPTVTDVTVHKRIEAGSGQSSAIIRNFYSVNVSDSNARNNGVNVVALKAPLSRVQDRGSSNRQLNPVIPLLSINFNVFKQYDNESRRRSMKADQRLPSVQLIPDRAEKKELRPEQRHFGNGLKCIRQKLAPVDALIKPLMSLQIELNPPKLKSSNFNCIGLKKDCPDISAIKNHFMITEVERNNKTRREFARIARDVSSENYEPPAGSRLLFGYYTYPTGKQELCAVACFQDAIEWSSKAPPHEDNRLFTYDHYNVIHYIFVLRDFRGFGYGKQLVEQIEAQFASNAIRRDIRLQAALGAVAFFEALGYKRVGAVKDTVGHRRRHGVDRRSSGIGSPLFRVLVDMSKKAQFT